jgi:L-aspartate-L-methionine ligase
MSRPLRPILAFDEVYGPGRTYAPRAHPQTCGWITRDPALLDWLTGNQLCVMGSMPVVCSAGATSPKSWELLAEAGIARASHPLTYTGEQKAFDVARGASDNGRLVVQHAYPDGVVDPAAQWVRPELLSYLNNKANLPHLVPATHVPPRTVYARARAFGVTPKLPVVFKAATDHSTGGGVAVAVCRTAQDVEKAAGQFESCTQVVVEDYLPIARNICMHFAVLPGGQSIYLGFADQDITEGGKYRGNWIELGARLPQATVDVALDVVRRGADLGYRGFVGIDIALLEGDADGRRTQVIDLNFRVNGSTAATLLAPAIRSAKGDGTLHLRTFVGQNGFGPMIASGKAAARSGKLIPLSAFDPEAAGHPGVAPRLVGLVRAESRRDALNIEADLAQCGLA